MEMDVYASITDLTAVYEKLNESLKSDPCTANAYQIYRQETYRDAYATLCTVSVEQIALHIIAEGKEDRMLARLRDLIRENIHICETRRNISSRMDFDALYQLQEEYLFAKRRTALLNDKKLIEGYPYPTEREREQLLQENRSELIELDNERSRYRQKNVAWICKDYYTAICEMSRSFATILDNYFPVAEEPVMTVSPESDEQQAEPKRIMPDEIFRSRMFDKLQELEVRLVKLGDLDKELHWQAKHKNGKPDIKRLVIFLAGLLDNGYFLPKRDVAIKRFFEERYQIPIGQNFERKRRELLVKEYRTIFYDLPF